MSLDGNIYRTFRIQRQLRGAGSHIKNPNYLEAYMANLQDLKPLISVYDRGPVVGVPHNRVQQAFANRCASGSVEQLNLAFLDDQLIDFTPFERLENSTVHVETDYVYLPKPQRISIS